MATTATIAVFAGCFILIGAQNTQTIQRFDKLDRTPYDWYNSRAPGTVDWNMFQSMHRCCGSNEPRDWFMRQPASNYDGGWNSYNPDANQGPEPLPPRYGSNNMNFTTDRYKNSANDIRVGLGPQPVPIPPRFPGQEMPRQPGSYQPSAQIARPPQNNQIPPQFPPDNAHLGYESPNKNNYAFDINDIPPPQFPPGTAPAKFPQNVLPPSCCRTNHVWTGQIGYCKSNPSSLNLPGCRTRINSLKHSLDYMAALMVLLGLGLAGLLILYSQICIVDVTEVRNTSGITVQSDNQGGSSRVRQSRNPNDDITPGFKV